MASYGLLGAIAGAGQGLVDYGDTVLKSSLEEAREQRLEAARLRAETRAIAEEERRNKRDLQQQFGERAAEVGSKGKLVLTSKIAAEQEAEQFPDKLERLKAEQRATDEAAQWGEEEDTKRAIRQAGAIRRAEEGSKPLTEADMRAIYASEVKNNMSRVSPESEEAMGALIDSYGGFDKWAEAYMATLDNNPGYLQWREDVLGIPNPDRRRAAPADTPAGILGEPAPGASAGAAPAAGAPGAAQTAARVDSTGAPIREGHRYRGPDNEVYVVVDGVPVLESTLGQER